MREQGEMFEGRTIMVAGAGPGLGREIGNLALREGGNVALAARTPEKLDALASDLDASGERVLAVPTDITDPAQCERFAEQTFGQAAHVLGCAAVDADPQEPKHTGGAVGHLGIVAAGRPNESRDGRRADVEQTFLRLLAFRVSGRAQLAHGLLDASSVGMRGVNLRRPPSRRERRSANHRQKR